MQKSDAKTNQSYLTLLFKNTVDLFFIKTQTYRFHKLTTNTHNIKSILSCTYKSLGLQNASYLLWKHIKKETLNGFQILMVEIFVIII